MSNFSFLSTMSYEELVEYMVVCYYAGDHDSSHRAIMEMERRYPERYYSDLYGDD